MLVYLLRQGIGLADLERGLNEDAGLRGVSGAGSDMRAVLAAAARGNADADLAVRMFVQRVVAIGALTATLGGLDALVFTGGIGEHSSDIRAAVCTRLAYLGIRLARIAIPAPAGDADLSASEVDPVRVLAITAREDLVILRDVREVLGW